MHARVSSNEQKDHLKSQIERLRKYAADRGYEIIKVLEEISSGLNENRKKLSWAYGMLERGDSEIFSAKLYGSRSQKFKKVTGVVKNAVHV